jgi:hypothetical protein
MQVKETRVARGAPPFIMKASASPIPSPSIKAGVSPFSQKGAHLPFHL